MDEYLDFEADAMLDAPHTVTPLPDGSIEFAKAGITSHGITRAKAMSEWGRKFADQIARRTID
jgi:hypothetical protein